MTEFHGSNEQSNSAGRNGISRRKLLASLGAAGLALATGGFPAGGSPVQAAALPMVYNVKDYGARGNGRMDENDALGLQSAIAAAAQSGGIVYLPAGRYVLKSAVLLQSRVSLIGAGIGATILMAGSDRLGLVTGSGVEHISIEGLTFRGMSKLSMLNTPQVESGIQLTAAKHIHIRDCEFSLIVNGVQVTDSEDVSVEHCRFEQITGVAGAAYEGFGIWSSGGGGHLFANNRFKSLFQPCIALTAGTSRSVAAYNRMENCFYTAIELSGDTADKPCEQNRIVGNVIQGMPRPNGQAQGCSGVRLLGACVDNAVTGNHIREMEEGGIRLESAANADEKVHTPRLNRIEGNAITASKSSGIVLMNASSNVVAANRLGDIQEDGILLYTDGEAKTSYCSRNTVSGNSLSGCGGSAIHLATARCEGNFVYGNAGYANKNNVTDLGTDTAASTF